MTAAPQSTRPALPPLPEPVAHVHSSGEFCAERLISSREWPLNVYTADQLRADRRQIVELCAHLIESQTLHRRRIHAACNGEPVKPCELAAALRSLLPGEPK